jgi:hypothetical protein
LRTGCSILATIGVTIVVVTPVSAGTAAGMVGVRTSKLE